MRNGSEHISEFWKQSEVPSEVPSETQLEPQPS